jgi:hypothetical protein
LVSLAGAAVIGPGLFWSFAGISKLVDVLMPVTSPDGQWIDEFPAWVIVVGTALEVIAGACILLGRRMVGLVLGATLLAGFTALLVARPLAPGQGCGCLGSGTDRTMLAAIDPVLRNAFLGALHVLGIAFVLPAKRSKDSLADTAPA